MTATAKTAASLYGRFPILVCVITWIMRIFVGGLFIFSGFTKGIDVWGTLFKFKDYFSVWGYEVWDSLNLAGVFILCLFEFLVGFLLLFGCMRRTAPILALSVMVLMLPLTLWLAVKNPIADCGCFGDALILSNWETFYKNVVLTLCIVWLLFYNTKARCLITPYLQWIAMLATGAYILIIAWVGYFYQPLIDFRPYKIGTELVEYDSHQDDDEDVDEDIRFVYEKDGVRKEFSIDDELPDEEDGWVFIERYTAPSSGHASQSRPVTEVKASQSKNLRFFSEDGRDDLTEEVVGNGKQLFLMIPVISEVSAAKTWKINSFYQWCQDNDIEMIATMGGNPLEIAEWKDISLAEYPIYTSDDTSIEEVVRGNPGIVYAEDGIIKWKSSLRAINTDDFQLPEVNSNPMSFARDNGRILWNITWIYLVIILLIVLFSFFPALFGLIFKPKRLIQKARHHKDKEMPLEEDKELLNDNDNSDEES